MSILRARNFPLQTIPRFRVVRAAALGECFGVRDAVAAARGVSDPAGVTILGELAHNPDLAAELAARGFRSLPEGVDPPADAATPDRTPAVLVTAHGTSDRRRAGLAAAGLRVIDTTCPLVRRVHAAAARFAADGRFVVLVGRPGHAEVAGVTGDLPPGGYAVIAGPDDAVDWNRDRLGVLMQSTTDPGVAAASVAAVRRANPHADVAVADTVCKPTRDRQAALADLCRRTDRVVVVGGANSHNTARLAAKCRAAGTPAVRVAGPAELDPAWLHDARTVGLTAGTSTPAAAVDAVEAALRRIAAGGR